MGLKNLAVQIYQRMFLSHHSTPTSTKYVCASPKHANMQEEHEVVVAPIDINLDSLDTKVIDGANALIKNDIAVVANIIMEEVDESFAAIVADILEEVSDTSFTLDNHYFVPFNIRVHFHAQHRVQDARATVICGVVQYFIPCNVRVVMESVYQYYLPCNVWVDMGLVDYGIKL